MIALKMVKWTVTTSIAIVDDVSLNIGAMDVMSQFQNWPSQPLGQNNCRLAS
jgi:hypothetical protein